MSRRKYLPMKRKARVFLWLDVLFGWYPGVMFAVASSVEEAREVLRGHKGTVEHYGICAPPEADLAEEPKVVRAPFGFWAWGGD